MNRLLIAVLTVVAAFGGLLLTFANKVGADAPGFCKDTVIASCVAPQSPVWALCLAPCYRLLRWRLLPLSGSGGPGAKGRSRRLPAFQLLDPLGRSRVARC